MSTAKWQNVAGSKKFLRTRHFNEFVYLQQYVLKPTLKNLQTNYTPSKSSRSSSIEQDETTIEVPHLKNEVVSNRKAQTPDKQTQDSNPALTATETGSDVKPDTKVFHSNDVDGDFMSRITKGGKRLFIEEFPQASSPGNYLICKLSYT